MSTTLPEEGIDAILDDEIVTDRIAAALAQRHPYSQRRPRYGTPATVVLRMLVLKHLNDWSFDECERDVLGSPVYRASAGSMASECPTRRR